MKWIFYVIVYGFLGFWVERVINLYFFGEWYDNSVLFGPVQPMYGVGVTLTLAAYIGLKRFSMKKTLRIAILCVVAIGATYLSEMVSGTLYKHFYGYLLWDYRTTFTVLCSSPHSCVIPTSIFGLLSAFTVVCIHPYIDSFLRVVPKVVKWMIIVLFLFDVIWTYKGVFLG